MNLPALQLKLSDLVTEYDQKVSAVSETIAEYERATEKLRASCVIGVTYGDRIDTRVPSEHEIRRSLIKSAWRRVYDGLNIERIASASDKDRFMRDMEKPAPFTLENIRATFGKFIADPRANIVRGLAEVFCNLDQAYKSHDKVRIGVKGLPKRVILPNVNEYGWGRDRLRDILNALAAYQNKSLMEYGDISALFKDGDALLESRGVSLSVFKNNNGHLFFEPKELRDINMALAEFYGEVLADCSEEKPTKKQASTAVSKDLQYYPTPQNVVDSLLDNIYIEKGDKILEPSCGCGRFMDALRAKGAEVYGVEFDRGRWQQCVDRGHHVRNANFLEVIPHQEYDRVIMNPPFYGKHYAKHVEHAFKFLKPGGVLTAILPATARYDHGLLDGKWYDLPFGSFSESGTNINTTVLTMRKESQEMRLAA